MEYLWHFWIGLSDVVHGITFLQWSGCIGSLRAHGIPQNRWCFLKTNSSCCELLLSSGSLSVLCLKWCHFVVSHCPWYQDTQFLWHDTVVLSDDYSNCSSSTCLLSPIDLLDCIIFKILHCLLFIRSASASDSKQKKTWYNTWLSVGHGVIYLLSSLYQKGNLNCNMPMYPISGGWWEIWS